MHDQIKLKLPYPVKFLGITFTREREIGFLFTNLYLYEFYDAHGFVDSKQVQEYFNNTPEYIVVSESLYFAAVAYCMKNRIKDNFTKEGLAQAIALLPESEKQKLADTWKKSQTFGTTYDKKKANHNGRKMPNRPAMNRMK